MYIFKYYLTVNKQVSVIILNNYLQPYEISSIVEEILGVSLGGSVSIFVAITGIAASVYKIYKIVTKRRRSLVSYMAYYLFTTFIHVFEFR